MTVDRRNWIGLRIASVMLWLSGCLTWRGATPDEFLLGNHLRAEHVLVVAGDHAIELDNATDDGLTLRGTVIRVWSVPGPFDGDYFVETDDEPTDVARHLGWRELPITASRLGAVGASATISIGHTEIKRLRVAHTDVDKGLKLTALVGGLALVVLLVIGIVELDNAGPIPVGD